jgi:IS30 family transposase
MSEIGRRMKRNKSTISRELSRNTDESHRVYFPDTAQEKMKTRRKQAKVIFASVSAKTMAEINRVTIKLFEPVKPAFRKTMTFDNGRGFCRHEKLSESLEPKTFFTNPYHSWERGLNEHKNGLIRGFYPKSTNFNIVKEEDFQRVVDFINHRPRKSLGYRTPYEVFFASSEPVAFHH